MLPSTFSSHTDLRLHLLIQSRLFLEDCQAAVHNNEKFLVKNGRLFLWKGIIEEAYCLKPVCLFYATIEEQKAYWLLAKKIQRLYAIFPHQEAAPETPFYSKITAVFYSLLSKEAAILRDGLNADERMRRIQEHIDSNRQLRDLSLSRPF